jgi:hypothetical protein
MRRESGLHLPKTFWCTQHRGSLIERYKPCGNPGCKCAQGQGHGPKYYLSTSRAGGQPAMEYVPKDSVTRVSEYVDNYRLVREILEEVCNINRELLRRRKPL